MCSITESPNHRTVGVGRDLWGSFNPIQSPYWSRVTYSRLHRTASRQVLNISREGVSKTALGNLFQCSVILRGKKFFLMFRWNFLCFSLCPLPLVLSLGSTEKSLAPSSWLTLQIFISIYKVPSQPSLLQAEQAQLPQPFLVGEILLSPHHLRCFFFLIAFCWSLVNEVFTFLIKEPAKLIHWYIYFEIPGLILLQLFGLFSHLYSIAWFLRFFPIQVVAWLSRGINLISFVAVWKIFCSCSWIKRKRFA